MTTHAMQTPVTLGDGRGPDVLQALQSVLDDPDLAWLPNVRLEGQLLRPLIATLGRDPGDAASDPRFWRAALAVQLAHEASLLHDDIVDGASTRRGRPTMAAERGVPAALVRGDQLLTAAYRLAAETASPAFIRLFARAVERTVAGELRQAAVAGNPISRATYREVVLGKSGELIGLALASSAAIRHPGSEEPVFELGRRVGLVYQMVDDLLDYCPGARTGKSAYSDHAQKKWTWVLDGLDPAILDADPDELPPLLLGTAEGQGRLASCLAELQQEIRSTLAEARFALRETHGLRLLLEDWFDRARVAVEAEREMAQPTTAGRRLRERLPELSEAGGSIAHHSRSFRLASRFFPASERARIERLYAFCRVTDDIGDGNPSLSRAERGRLLDQWARAAEGAWRGEVSGIPLLDELMRETRAAGISFQYAAELIRGVRTDLDETPFHTWEDLDLYCYRVASVVGQWITEFAGIREPRILAAAADLGRAMQLTNIARDVGEDLGMGRVYLPSELLATAGLDAERLREMKAQAEVTDEYRGLIEGLLQRAEGLYRSSVMAIGHLPRSYRAPVAVAARVYSGIHGAIRANDYDNLTRRARTGGFAKTRLSSAGLVHAARVSLFRPVVPISSPVSPESEPRRS